MAQAALPTTDHGQEFSTLSGVTADLMRQLLDFHEERHSSDNLMKDHADALERDVLDGQIQVKRFLAGGYPDFVYQPRNTKGNRSLG